MSHTLPHPSWYVTTVMGEIASKSNSRKLVTVHGRPRLIKSQKARDYERDFGMQARRLEQVLEGDVILAVRSWYKTRRPDLDISHLKDCLQGYAYANDRQVKIEHAVWDMDPVSPRCHIVVAPIEDAPQVITYLTDKDLYATNFRQ